MTKPTAPSRTRSYLAGLSSGYVFALVSVLVGLWLTPFVLRYLDAEQYAVYALAGDLLLWLTLLDLGIGAGLRAQAATLHGEDADLRLSRLVSTAVLAQALTAAVVLVGGGALAWWMPRFFAVGPGLERDAVRLMALLALGAAASLASQPFSALLVARQRVQVANYLRLGGVLLRSAGTVALLLAGVGLLALPIASLAATALTSAVAVAFAHRAVPTLRVRWEHVSLETLRSVSGLGIWFSLGGLAGLAIESLDRVVAGKTIALAAVTTLALTGRLYVLVYSLLQQVTNTARPMLGQMLGEGRTAAAVRVYHQLFAVSSGTALVVAAAVWAGNGQFVAWWVGEAHYGGVWLDVALAANLVVHCWVLPNRALLASALVVRPQTLGRLVEGVANLGLSVVLGMRFGIAGVAAGTAVAGVLTSCWYLPWLTARHFGLGFGRLLWEDVSRLLVLAAGLAPVAVLARGWGEGVGGLAGALGTMAATGAGGAALLWAVGLDDATRGRIRRVLRSRVPLTLQRLERA